MSMAIVLASLYVCSNVRLYRIVRSFESIVRNLLQQENFTNLTVVREDVAFRGERVSYTNIARMLC